MRRGPSTVLRASADDPPREQAVASSPTEEPLRTEFSFLLPRGYVDAAGTVHRDGVMTN